MYPTAIIKHASCSHDYQWRVYGGLTPTSPKLYVTNLPNVPLEAIGGFRHILLCTMIQTVQLKGIELVILRTSADFGYLVSLCLFISERERRRYSDLTPNHCGRASTHNTIGRRIDPTLWIH